MRNAGCGGRGILCRVHSRDRKLCKLSGRLKRGWAAGAAGLGEQSHGSVKKGYALRLNCNLPTIECLASFTLETIVNVTTLCSQ